MDNYSKKVIICLFLTVICLIFLLCFVRAVNYAWTDFLQGIAISLLASFLFYIVFYKFNDPNNKDDKIDPSFVRIGSNSKMGREYWIGLIKELSSTRKDIYFYGNKLSLWLEEPIYKDILLKELKKERKSKRKNKKVYFILHDKKYMDKWRSFFEENNISVNLIHLNENNCYSIVYCGHRMSITLRTNIGRSEDSPSFEVTTESEVGKLFLEYLKYIVKEQNIPNVL